jgi:hypothetical protein
MSADFDKLIDHTVRQMLDVEPQAGMRARVLRRISESDRPVASRFSRKILWLAAPMAAAMIALAVVLPQRAAQPPVAGPVARAGDTPLPAERTPQQPSALAVTSTTAAPHNTAQRSRAWPVRARVPVPNGGGRVLAADAPDPGAMAIEPLDSIAPIQVAPVGARDIAPSAISIAPLNTITELQVAPLTPPGGRN